MFDVRVSGHGAVSNQLHGHKNAQVWKAISGAESMQRRASPIYYADLAQRGESDALRESDWEASKQIENVRTALNVS